FGTAREKAMEAPIAAIVVHLARITNETATCQGPVSYGGYPGLINAAVVGSVEKICGAGVIGELDRNCTLRTMVLVSARRMGRDTYAGVRGDDSVPVYVDSAV